MGLSLISVENRKSLPLLVFNALAEELTLEFCNGGSAQKLVIPLADDGWKEFDDMCIHFDTVQ